MNRATEIIPNDIRLMNQVYKHDSDQSENKLFFEVCIMIINL